MDYKQLTNSILQKCPEAVKTAWKPIKAKNPNRTNGTKAKRISKFGGNDPFRKNDFVWPVCDECDDEKSFLCQISLETLPAEMQDQINRHSGIFQFFYCTGCTPFPCFDDMNFISKEEMMPSLKSLVASFVYKKGLDTDDLPKSVQKFIADWNEEIPCNEDYQITENMVERWEPYKHREIPQAYEIIGRVLGKKFGLSDDYEVDIPDEPESDGESETIVTPQPGIKLGGYINWCQGIEYPTCPDCDIEMTIPFLQFEKNEMCLYAWGDSGTGHITLCPTCYRPGMGWACC